jgi:hypothetical protein
MRRDRYHAAYELERDWDRALREGQAEERGGGRVNLFEPEELSEITKRDDRDYFQTPREAVLPMIPYLKKEWRIWEPCCGEGNILRVLCENDFDAYGTDVLQGFDFFTTHRSYDAIFTNPPFSTADNWLEECYRRGKPFALLLPIYMLGGKRRQNMFRTHGIQIYMLGERVRFKTPSGLQGRQSSPTLETAWFCWQMNLPDTVVFGTLQPQ